jgi:hypothetical protein
VRRIVLEVAHLHRTVAAPHVSLDRMRVTDREPVQAVCNVRISQVAAAADRIGEVGDLRHPGNDGFFGHTEQPGQLLLGSAEAAERFGEMARQSGEIGAIRAICGGAVTLASDAVFSTRFAISGFPAFPRGASVASIGALKARSGETFPPRQATACREKVSPLRLASLGSGRDDGCIRAICDGAVTVLSSAVFSASFAICAFPQFALGTTVVSTGALKARSGETLSPRQATTCREKVSPLRLASLGSGRDDACISALGARDSSRASWSGHAKITPLEWRAPGPPNPSRLAFAR